MTWQPIETAPKDGTAVLLLSAAHTTDATDDSETTYTHAPKCHIGKWWAGGTSWVDEYGQLGESTYTLAKTGVWLSGGGWFQPNEVTHWQPLPEPPANPLPHTGQGGAES